MPIFSDVYSQNSNQCVFSPDSNLLAVGLENEIIVRKSDTLGVLATLQSVSALSTIEFSADSKYILGASYDAGVVQIWKLNELQFENDTNREVAKIEEGVSGCIRAIWHPGQRSIITWSVFGLRINIWDLISQKLHVIKDPKLENRGVSFRPCGRYLAVLERVQKKDAIGIYDCVRWEMVTQYQIDSELAADLEWSPNGRFIAVWESLLNYKLMIYTGEGRLVSFYSPTDFCLGIKSVKWSPNSQFLAVGGSDLKLRIFNCYTWSPIIEWGHGTVNVKKIVVYDESQTIDKELGWVNSIRSTYLRTPLETINLNAKDTKKSGIYGICWSKCGLLLAAYKENFVFVYSVVDAVRLAILKHKDSVRQISWHPTSNVLYICTGSCSLYTWRKNDEDQEAGTIQIPLREFCVFSFRISNQGNRIVVMDKSKHCVSFEDDENL